MGKLTKDQRSLLTGTHFVRFTHASWLLAHGERKARAERLFSERKWEPIE